MKRLKLCAALVLMVPVLTGCEVVKTENPLAPTVAGPIPGVAITAPGIAEPGDGTRITVDKQPITLMVSNSNTSGVRPLTYRFEVASDKNFSNIVFSKADVAPAASGKTSATVTTLAPERGYYWRAKAYDGANDGDYSATVYFEVYTPVVLSAPTPKEPTGTITTRQPRFKIANAPRTGPAGAILYNIQIATGSSFATLTGNWFMDETVRRVVPRLARDALDDHDVLLAGAGARGVGRRRPLVGNGVVHDACGHADARRRRHLQPAVHLGTRHPDVPPQRLRHADDGGSEPGDAEGVGARSERLRPRRSQAPVRLAFTRSRANCNGYSCDIICRTDGSWWDVLSDSDNTAVPQWSGTPNTGLSPESGPACEAVP